MSETNTYRMICKTFTGLEEILAEEIKNLGGTDIKILKRGVEFYGDQLLMYRANYWLRTAINVLKPIHKFEARTPAELYDGMRYFEWMKYFDIGNTISIKSTSYKSELNHTQYISQKAKDGIVDYFRYKFNRRPDVDRLDADVQLYIHVNNNEVEVSLNSSGLPLFRRGYRQEVGPAPLNEILASGLILMSGWDKKSNFVDPMCGSGTIATEAALIAMNIPPAFYRDRFSFMFWSDYSRLDWERVKEDAFKEQVDFEGEICAYDYSPKMIEIANKNIHYAKLHKDIEVKQVQIKDSKPPEGHGVVIINPPYGERIRTKDIENLYSEIGTALKFNYEGYQAFIISSDFEAMKKIGLRTFQRKYLQNGSLECKYYGYNLYDGSKKAKKNIDED